MIFKDLAKHFTESYDEYMHVLQERIFFGECNEDFVELIGKEKELHKIKEWELSPSQLACMVSPLSHILVAYSPT